MVRRLMQMKAGQRHRRALTGLLRLPVLSALVLLVACGTIQPETTREPEMALSPAPFSAWPALEQTREQDSLVPLNLGGKAMVWRLQALRSASRSIDLQTFIWKTDAIGLAILDEVLAAADRGVRVRVLLDDSFLAHADAALHALSSHPNIAYRIYNPLAQFAPHPQHPP